MLTIYIPSHKRAHMLSVPPLFHTLVVYEEEADEYLNLNTGIPLLIHPNEHGRGIWNKCRHILAHAQKMGHEKIAILDDDLVFAARRTDDPTKFRPMESEDWAEMVATASFMLDHYLHGAIACREGGNRLAGTKHQINSRAIRAVLLRPLDILRAGVNYREGFMQDFDLTLQLLSRGFPNFVMCDWVHNQSGSNTEGGCSETRTMEIHAESARELKRRWPKYVTLVEKETKGAWGGGTRTDVRIAWKKCYNDGV